MKVWAVAVLTLLQWAAVRSDLCKSCQRKCSLHDDRLGTACVWDDLAREVSGSSVDELTPQYRPGGDWGAILYPSIDLSQLSVQQLLDGGVSQSTVTTMSSLLAGGITGQGVQFLLAALPPGTLTLSQADADAIVRTFTAAKLFKLEAYYNLAVHRRGEGTCFVDLPRYQKSFLLGAAWAVVNLQRFQCIQLALDGKWEEVKNDMLANSNGLFKESFKVFFFQNPDDMTTVECPPADAIALPPSFPPGHPCHPDTPHGVLDESYRSVDAPSGTNCDKDILDNQAWYRVQLSTGENALAESCPPLNRCGTVNALYMTSAHPTVEGAIVDRQVSSRVGDTCGSSGNHDIRVVRCPQFFLYKLWTPDVCSLSYCAAAVPLQ